MVSYGNLGMLDPVKDFLTDLQKLEHIEIKGDIMCLPSWIKWSKNKGKYIIFTAKKVFYDKEG